MAATAIAIAINVPEVVFQTTPGLRTIEMNMYLRVSLVDSLAQQFGWHVNTAQVGDLSGKVKTDPPSILMQTEVVTKALGSFFSIACRET